MKKQYTKADLKKLSLDDLCILVYDDYPSVYDKLSKDTRKLSKGAQKEIVIKWLLEYQNDEASLKQNERVMLNTKKEIRVVVVAMTYDEAKELISETSMSAQAILPLLNLLRWNDSNSLLNCYGEKREHWKPLNNGLILHVIEEIEVSLSSKGINVLFQYQSASFFDDQECNDIWDELENNECILIVDAISMYHPNLNLKVLQSQLFKPENRIAVGVIEPLPEMSSPIQTVLEKDIYTRYLQRPFFRFENFFDLFYEFGIGDIRKLRRWLFQILPKLSIGIEERGLTHKQQMSIRAKSRKTPQNIGKKIIGSIS